jgi:hypothetical protein
MHRISRQTSRRSSARPALEAVFLRSGDLYGFCRRDWTPFKHLHGSGFGGAEADLIPEAPAVDEIGGEEQRPALRRVRASS